MKTLQFTLTLLLAGIPLAAAQTTWNTTASGDWNNAANWTTGVPDSADAVLINQIGTYTISDGGANGDASTITIGSNTGVNASLDFTGQTLTLSSSSGTSFAVSSTNSAISLTGGFVNAGGTALGNTSTASGNTLSLTAGSTLTTSQILVGRLGSDSNTFNIGAGADVRGVGGGSAVAAIAVGQTASGGDSSGTANVLNVSGSSTLLQASSITIGHANLSSSSSSSNQLNISNGATVTASGNVIVGRLQSGTAANNNLLSVGTNSVFTVSGTTTIGSGAATGNQLTVAGTNNLGGVLAVGGLGGNNTVTVNSGGLVNATNAGTSIANVSGNGIVINTGGTFDASGQTITNNRSVSVSGGTLKVGTLSGASSSSLNFSAGVVEVGTYTSAQTTAVAVGNGSGDTATLRFTGTNTHSFQAGLTVNSDGILTGAGLIQGNGATNTTVTLSGQLMPGGSNSVGTLNLTGDLVSNSGTEYLFNIGAADSFDRLIGTGNVGFNGTLRVTLLNAYNPALNASFQLFQFGSYSGTSLAYDLPTLSGGLSWNTSSFLTNGTISVVPEPSTVVAAAGLVGLMLWPLRRRILRRAH